MNAVDIAHGLDPFGRKPKSRIANAISAVEDSRVRVELAQVQKMHASVLLELAEIRGIVSYLNTKLEHIMQKTSTDLTAEIARLVAAEQAYVQQNKDTLTALQAHADDLQKKIDAGEDLQAQFDQIQGVIDLISTPPTGSTAATTGTTGDTTTTGTAADGSSSSASTGDQSGASGNAGGVSGS